MNQELKERWIRALKSGAFKQAQCSLINETGDAYCCLGVMGILLGLGNNRLRTMRYSTPGTERVNINDKLSMRILKRIGLTVKQQNTLADINDYNEGFYAVIRYIEENI